MSYQFTLLCISIVCAACILVLLRKSLLHPLHAVWWLAVALIILLAGLAPRAFDAVGHTLGVTYPPTLYLAIAVVVILVRMLAADLERCKMMLQQRRINQHLARLSLRVRQIERGQPSGAEPVALAAHDSRLETSREFAQGGNRDLETHEGPERERELDRETGCESARDRGLDRETGCESARDRGLGMVLKGVSPTTVALARELASTRDDNA